MFTVACILVVIGLYLLLSSNARLTEDQLNSFKHNLENINAVLTSIDSMEESIHKLYDYLPIEQQKTVDDLLTQCAKTKKLVKKWKHYTEAANVRRANRLRELSILQVKELDNKVKHLTNIV